MTLELSRNITLLLIFLGLIILKTLDFNSAIDEMIILIIGAIIGREVLSNVKTRVSGPSEDRETS